MAKYINQEHLLETISERNRNTCNGSMSCLQMKRMVEAVPAVDAVPVVRCGECLNHIHEDDVDFLCTRTGVYTRHDDFCSYGERRDENV